MKISLDWLRDYVRVDLPVRELVDRLTMIGLVAESVEDRDGDPVLDVETYANRPDTLGHLGMAREVAVLLGLPLETRAWPILELPETTASAVDVQVADEALCPRYCGLVVRGLTVGPSPEWLRRRIEAMGLRPINNVVDTSNYVLFATGHPTHIFDIGKLGGRKIVVRRARRGESLRLLDGRTVELQPDMLVIADENRPAALAGVMGGEETGVSEATRDVFIESAVFDPVSIRLTARRLGVATDASYRFERGADIGFAPEAALMAASLLSSFGGRATKGLADVYPRPRKPKSVVLRDRRLAELLGVVVPEEFTTRTLEALGFKVEETQKGVWRVGVPSFRVDIDREADLVEEVARFYGYDRIPSELTPLRSWEPPPVRKRERAARLRQALCHQGLDEVVNTSFADPEKEAVFPSGRQAIAIRNPISVRTSLLRTTLFAGLLENTARNIHRGAEGVHIFEIGNVYSWQDEKPRETLSLACLSTGLLPASSFRDKPRAAALSFLKGAIEAALGYLRYEPWSFAETEAPAFEPGSALDILFKGERVGVLGRLKPEIPAAFSLEGPVFAAEIGLGGLLEKQARPFQYAPVPRFPAVERDLSFLVDRDVAYGDIRRALDKLALPYLESFELRDRFAGPPVPRDKVSLTLRFRFRNPQRTLLAEEADRVAQDLTGHLRAAFDVQLREGGKIDNGA